jgi:hypothetical protein
MEKREKGEGEGEGVCLYVCRGGCVMLLRSRRENE